LAIEEHEKLGAIRVHCVESNSDNVTEVTKMKVDISTFSPRVQQIIAEFETAQEAWRIAHETDLERARRLGIPEEHGLQYLFLSAIVRQLSNKSDES
jgi:hypothetical protein